MKQQALVKEQLEEVKVARGADMELLVSVRCAGRRGSRRGCGGIVGTVHECVVNEAGRAYDLLMPDGSKVGAVLTGQWIPGEAISPERARRQIRMSWGIGAAGAIERNHYRPGPAEYLALLERPSSVALPRPLSTWCMACERWRDMPNITRFIKAVAESRRQQLTITLSTTHKR